MPKYGHDRRRLLTAFSLESQYNQESVVFGAIADELMLVKFEDVL